MTGRAGCGMLSSRRDSPGPRRRSGSPSRMPTGAERPRSRSTSRSTAGRDPWLPPRRAATTVGPRGSWPRAGCRSGSIGSHSPPGPQTARACACRRGSCASSSRDPRGAARDQRAAARRAEPGRVGRSRPVAPRAPEREAAQERRATARPYRRPRPHQPSRVLALAKAPPAAPPTRRLPTPRPQPRTTHPTKQPRPMAHRSRHPACGANGPADG